MAACSGGPLGPAFLSKGVAGMTETCAPVSTRKRRPVLSVLNSCGSRGPADAVVTDGPPWRFPVVSCMCGPC